MTLIKVSEICSKQNFVMEHLTAAMMQINLYYYVMEKFRHDKIGVILQSFALIEDLSVYENIALPLKYQKISSKEIKRRVLDVMGEFGLTDKKNYYPEELSGGQQQRVAIARALIQQPEIVIADEPTGALDEDNTKKIINILKKMNQRGITLIIATHDKNISDICDGTLFLKDGILEEKKGI
ncbi:MAG: ABC transporter ATP-binding protein [Acetivibrio ethanolgignens]